MAKPTIAIDFDGVIHAYSKGWQDGTIYDPPIKGVREAMESLRKKFWVMVFSTRATPRLVNGVDQKGQADEIREYLTRHKIPCDQVYTGYGKPLCKLLVDDNVYRFEGNWDEALNDIEELLKEDY